MQRYVGVHMFHILAASSNCVYIRTVRTMFIFLLGIYSETHYNSGLQSNTIRPPKARSDAAQLKQWMSSLARTE